MAWRPRRLSVGELQAINAVFTAFWKCPSCGHGNVLGPGDASVIIGIQQKFGEAQRMLVAEAARAASPDPEEPPKKPPEASETEIPAEVVAKLDGTDAPEAD